ncbi:MAG: ComEC/Rec2 family competence protein, partial [Clostridia bacterium]|nr:ComEC/Rec2 family competence protein [Clostridia bacterium]
FTGIVISDPYTNGTNTHFTVKTLTINGEQDEKNISVTTNYTVPTEIYDLIECHSKLESSCEEGYGYASYYGARNIFLTTYISSYSNDSHYKITENENKPFYSIFHDIRKYAALTFQKYLPFDEASLSTAMITGDKNYLRDEIYTPFKKLGISHILVVSGLHLSIVSGVFAALISVTNKNKYISALMQIIPVVFFAAVSGFSFSVRRAMIMSLIAIISPLLSQRSDGLNSLGIAAFLLCLNPLNVGDVGMLWSFSCTASILIYSQRIYKFIVERFEVKNGFAKKFVTVLSTSTAAFVGSLPLLFFVAESFSPYTLIVNILTVPFTGLVIICGGLSVLFFAAKLTVLAYPLMFVSGLTAKYFIFITDLFSKLPYSFVKTNSPLMYFGFGLIVFMILTVIVFDKKKRYRGVCVLISAAVLIGSFCIEAVIKSDKITLSVLDVGNGLAVTVKNRDNVIVLNSYGEKYQYSTIKNELSNYEQVACMIDIPPYKTNYDYCRRIANDFDIRKVLVYGNYYYDKYSYLRYSSVDVENISRDYTLYMFGDSVLNISSVKGCAWEYLYIYSTEILICPLNADFSKLPAKFKNPDIAILGNSTQNFDFDEDVYIIVSSYGDECFDTCGFLKNRVCVVEATNGNGRIDLTFSKNNNVDISREYTGGVTRYAKD